jgi:hypothetical protein
MRRIVARRGSLDNLQRRAFVEPVSLSTAFDHAVGL